MSKRNYVQVTEHRRYLIIRGKESVRIQEELQDEWGRWRSCEGRLYLEDEKVDNIVRYIKKAAKEKTKQETEFRLCGIGYDSQGTVRFDEKQKSIKVEGQILYISIPKEKIDVFIDALKG